MELLKKTLFFYFIFIYSFYALSQDKDLLFGVEINTNLISKKRSYGIVYSTDKFYSTDYLLGLDASIYGQVNNHQFGAEIFPYIHTNFFYGFELLHSLGVESNFRIIPDVKYGYSWDLKKHYSGIGLKLQYRWINFKFNQIYHIKSGESKYWGDGLTGFNLGLVFRISNARS